MHKTLANLMSGSAYERITRIPEGLGGGEDIDTTDESYFEDGLDTGQGNEELGFGGEDEINNDADLDLSNFWEGTEDTQDEETPEQRTERLREEEKAMGTQLQEGLAAFNLGDDVFPEDFDPSDRNQLREVMTNAMRQGAAMTLQLMFKPVNAAIRTHNENLRSYVNASLNSNNADVSFEAMVSREIPAVNDKLAGPMVRQVIAAQRKRFPNDPKAAIRAARTGLRAMGISTQVKTQGQRGGGASDDAFALDGFFPGLEHMQRQQQRQASQQVRSKLKK